jgi:hypothetical protein
MISNPPRTNIPSLAPNLSRIRIHRDRHHSIIPTQHRDIPTGWPHARGGPERASFSTYGETARIDVFGYRHCGIDYWREEIF